MKVVKYDAERVNDLALELWKDSLNSGNYDERKIEDWLLDIKKVNEDDYNQDPDEMIELYQDDYIDYLLDNSDEIPSEYIELAANELRDEAEENGYTGRFS